MPVLAEPRNSLEPRTAPFVSQTDQLIERAIAGATSVLEKAAAEVRTILLSLPPGALGPGSIAGVKTQILDQVDAAVSWMLDWLPTLVQRAAELGQSVVDEALRGLGTLLVGKAGPPSTSGPLPGVLAALQNYSADLIRGISEAARRRINGILAQVANGTLNAYEAMQAIAAALPDPSVFRSMMARAEAIYRTELGRIFSTAAQFRLNQSAAFLPGLQKQWLTVMDGRERPTHGFAHQQIVGATEKFIVGGWECSFPRDPVLPPAESINCRCAVVPYLSPDLLAGLGVSLGGL